MAQTVCQSPYEFTDLAIAPKGFELNFLLYQKTNCVGSTGFSIAFGTQHFGQSIHIVRLTNYRSLSVYQREIARGKVRHLQNRLWSSQSKVSLECCAYLLWREVIKGKLEYEAPKSRTVKMLAKNWWCRRTVADGFPSTSAFH